MSQACKICGDEEPFHVHDGGRRIEDYFTVGRGMSDIEAARAWKERALLAEHKMREPPTKGEVEEARDVIHKMLLRQRCRRIHGVGPCDQARIEAEVNVAAVAVLVAAKGAAHDS